MYDKENKIRTRFYNKTKWFYDKIKFQEVVKTKWS